MNVQCTTAELPSLLPILAGLNKAFHLTVTDAPAETTMVAAQPVATPASAKAAEPASAPSVETQPGKGRWYTTQQVAGIFKHSTTKSVTGLMSRAGIEPIRVSGKGKWGKQPNHYDADRVDALKKLFDETLTMKDAADLMGDKSLTPIMHHTERRRITPTEVAGHVRYRLEDLEQLMKLRKRA
ncbi:hypothetical protein [Burkholderia glumae]|uniref:hypothetical protein n=1 Tax=Burkholderia glumae TaxID=337 RepID=UPI000C2806B6|nr:hypothetical protein [Burkholderia glumae]PJO21633.1 hypothetical protein Y5A_018210 [Burkholderia glumae AU6208]QHE10577.1 hypothetical protein GQR88_09330 [Burkholderia glumae AU6208]